MFLPFDGVHAIVNPPVDIAGAYASGDLLFAPIEIQNAVQETKGSSLVRSILILDQAVQKPAMDLLFFNQDPGSLAALNAAVTVNATQLLMLIGMQNIATGDWTVLQSATNAAAMKLPSYLLLPAIKGSKSIWMAGVARAAATYVAITDLTIKLALERH